MTMPRPERQKPASSSHAPVIRSDVEAEVARMAAVLFVLATVLLLPPAAAAATLLAALVSYPLLLAAAHRAPAGAMTMMFATAAPALPVLFVLRVGMGIRDNRLGLISMLAVYAAGLLWVSVRYQADNRPEARTFLIEAVMIAILATVAVSLFACIPIAISILADGKEALPRLLVFPGYLAGFAGVAVVFWFLQRIAHRPSGLYLLGVLGGACVYAAIGTVMLLTGDERVTPWEIPLSALVLGSLMGPSLAFHFLWHE